MADTCPTVRVSADNEEGFIVINEEDFDAATHSKFEDDPADEKAEKAALVEQIVALGGDKPHHATGVAKLQEILAALPPAA